MPTLLLHIGTHKTGTTSIQHFCSANRDVLRELGVWYPEPTLGGFRNHTAHHHVANAISGRNPKLSRQRAADFFATVLDQARPDEKVLISAESLYRRDTTPEVGATSSSDPESSRERRMSAYVEAVAECIADFDTTVLVMLRRQDLFAESLYSENILNSGYSDSIDEFVSDIAHLLDYEARLGVWAEAFGIENMSVRTYEASTLTAPIEEMFVDWLGVSWTDRLVIGERQRVTPPKALVEFQRAINTAGQDAQIKKCYRRWIDMLADRVAPSELPDLGRYYLQPRDRVRLLERHEEGNHAVAAKFLGRDELFVDDVSSVIARYTDARALEYQDFRELSKQLIQLIAEQQVGAVRNDGRERA